MSDFELAEKQKRAVDAFNSTIADDVERYRWNVGNPPEDPIFPPTVKETPTTILEVLYPWLEEQELVLFPHGPENRKGVVLSRLKNRLYNKAAAHLDKNNKVLLPNGDTVPIEQVEVKDGSEG